MATPARGQEYADSQAQIVALALAELAAFWSSLDLSKPTAAKAAVAEFMATLVDSYGSLSSTIAADFYDELREAAAPGGRFVALVGSYANFDQIRGASDWAVQPLFPSIEPIFEAGPDGEPVFVGEREIAPDPTAALERLQGATQRLVQDAGRQTIVDNVERDPSSPGWARMPIGETCKFCRMLASRGAVYTSRDKALFKEEGGRYHDWCDCEPVPVWSDADLPYDPQPYLDEYLADRAGGKSAGGSKSKAKAPSQPGGFDSLTRDQIRRQIAITEALPDSGWRTKQLDRLRARLKQL